MVKKTSFLEKLKGAWRTSGVRVESSERSSTTTRSSAGTRAGAGNRVAAGRADAPPPRPESAPIAAVRDEPVSSRKISNQEAAVVAIQDGFQDLAKLLKGMHERIDQQGGNLDALPELQRSQLETLRTVAARLEAQRSVNEQLAQRLGDLPNVMADVKTALDRAAATDERSAKTLDDFRSNMDRISSTMQGMVDAAEKQADAVQSIADGERSHGAQIADAVRGEQEKHAEAVERMLENTERSTGEGIRALRDAQADQANRLTRIVEEGSRTNRAVLILLGLVFTALVVLIGVLGSS